MTRIGVVSDTHGQFDPYLPELFRGVAHILHGGDVGPESIVETLEEIAPVTAVRGNTDRDLHEGRYPVYRTVEVEGTTFLLTHIVPDPTRPDPELRRRIDASGARVVVYGHTHVPRAIESGGVLFLNPGSAGPRRFRLPRSAAILEIGTAVLRPVFHDLDLRAPFDPSST